MKPYIFVSPSKYVQGADAIFTIGEFVKPLGDKALVVGGESGLAVTREGRDKSFSECRITQTEELFQGESSETEIDRVCAAAAKGGCNVIIACGGGKVIDTVKASAAKLLLPCIIVPTVASNDSPCSSLSIIYNDNGTFDRLQMLEHNPDVVLADTRIIANAPVRQLVSGMGDALATWFEAEAGYRNDALNCSGGRITRSAMALAKLCFDTLMEFGVGAKLACENKIVTPALEKIVEANILLSGVGFESGAVALAHALSEGLSVIPGTHKYSHGELVAFCLLPQLIMDSQPHEVITQVFGFCRAVGLPVTLAEIGAEPGELLRQAAEIASEPGRPSHNLPFEISGELIYDAILAADAVGRLGE